MFVAGKRSIVKLADKPSCESTMFAGVQHEIDRLATVLSNQLLASWQAQADSVHAENK